jgi:hypothetical protein
MRASSTRHILPQRRHLFRGGETQSQLWSRILPLLSPGGCSISAIPNGSGPRRSTLEPTTSRPTAHVGARHEAGSRSRRRRFATMRGLIRAALERDPEVAVIGQAADPLRRVRRSRP